MTNEEEKGEGRVLDLDKISGEGKTLNDLIESGEDIPDELKESLKTLTNSVSQALAGTLKRPMSQLLQGIKDSVGSIPTGRLTWADVAGMVDRQDKVVNILKELLEAGRARERRIVILTAIGWGIAIIAIAVQVITWWLGR